jgi:hypothetical protein
MMLISTPAIAPLYLFMGCLSLLSSPVCLDIHWHARSKDAALKIGGKIQEGGVEGIKRSSSGTTFSASALVAMAGKGPSKMEQLAKEQLAKTDEHIQATRDLKEAMEITVTA